MESNINKNVFRCFSLLILFLIMDSCNGKANKQQISKKNGEIIFREVFFIEGEASEKIPELKIIKKFLAYDTLNSDQKRAFNNYKEFVFNDIKKIYPDFYQDFGAMIQSGDPLLVQAGLKLGGEKILLSFNFLYPLLVLKRYPQAIDSLYTPRQKATLKRLGELKDLEEMRDFLYNLKPEDQIIKGILTNESLDININLNNIKSLNLIKNYDLNINNNLDYDRDRNININNNIQINKQMDIQRNVNINRNLALNRNTDLGVNKNTDINGNIDINQNKNINLNDNVNINKNININTNVDVNRNSDLDVSRNVDVNQIIDFQKNININKNQAVNKSTDLDVNKNTDINGNIDVNVNGDVDKNVNKDTDYNINVNVNANNDQDLSRNADLQVGSWFDVNTNVVQNKQVAYDEYINIKLAVNFAIFINVAVSVIDATPFPIPYFGREILFQEQLVASITEYYNIN